MKELLQTDRRRLLRAVVDLHGEQQQWRRLYGSHLTPEERFVAVMTWARSRDRRDFLTRLRRTAKTTIERPTVPTQRASASALRTYRNSTLDPLAGRRSPVLDVALGYRSTTFRSPLFPTAATLFAERGSDALGGVNTRELVKAATAAIRTQQTMLGSANARELVKAASVAARMQQTLSASGVIDAVRIGRQLSINGRFKSVAIPTLPSSLERVLRPTAGVDLASHFRATAALRLAPLYRAVEELVDGADAAFIETWEQDPLWFLIAVLETSSTRGLAFLRRDQVEELLVLALEAVIRDGTIIAALLQAINNTPVLEPWQKAQLATALGFTQAGDWRTAGVLLLVALEGAIKAVPAARHLISGRGKAPAVEAVVKRIELEDAYRSLVVRRVFGGDGNAVRHGQAPPEKENVVYAVVALAGWVQTFTAVPAMDLLGEQVTVSLRAVSRDLHAPA